MEIILLERVEKLGQMGDVVTVKNGYARNFLIPQRKALRATKANKEAFEGRKAQLEADNLQRRQEADAVAGKMTDMVITLIRAAGESNQLYGSVSARDVADAVTAGGATIERRQVRIAAPIKYLGLHPIRIALHPEVDVEITANVARSEDEAVLQLERGTAAPTAAERDAEVDAELAAEQAAEYAAVQAEVEAEEDEAAKTERAEG
ncbi:MAG: 50S ribosomal protein L9 [Pseudomonadota bacterium]